MLRALFEKTGDAVWMSHLDLMRVFQRAFKRAGLPLTHTQGFNPRPSVSIALPMSVGVSSVCELLDFDLDGQAPSCQEIRDRLNEKLVSGVRVVEVYTEGSKIKNLAYMDARVELEYDAGVPQGALEALQELFSRQSVTVEKKGKNGVTQQDIIPMIRTIRFSQSDHQTVLVDARVCCQNPSLNPMQISAAIALYLPQLRPDLPNAAGWKSMTRMKQFFDKEIFMEQFIELEECPACRGNGMLVHEGGWNVQVECADCGSHTVYVEYENEEQKREAEKKVAMLWNIGKVIKANIGE